MKKRKPPLGREILAICKEKGISQKQMANAMGIERQYLNNVINGHKLPSIDLLGKIARHYNKNVVIKFCDKIKYKQEQKDLGIEQNPQEDIGSSFSF